LNELALTFVDILARVLFIAMIGRVVVSWLNIGQSSPMYPIVSIIHQITEPILAPIRRVLPNFGMLDLSPMVALILITFIQKALVGLIS
jgi:YggT family protein